MAKKEEPKITAEQPQVDPKVMIDGLVQKAKVALDEYMKLDQEQIDNITKAAALAGLSAQMELASAVESVNENLQNMTSSSESMTKETKNAMESVNALRETMEKFNM